MSKFKTVMSAQEIETFLAREFPQIHLNGQVFSVTSVSPGTSVLRLETNDTHLRPGGTVSGPTLFALADLSAYVSVLAHLGPVPLAVTTSLNIDFLRKPPPTPLVGRSTLLKLGRRLAVMRIDIEPEDAPGDLLAHAVATYALPANLPAKAAPNRR